MQPIIPPIRPTETGTTVVNLQEALFALIEHEIIRVQVSPSRPTSEEVQKLSEKLKEEKAASVFGEATQQLVFYIQLQHGLGDHLGGTVEGQTAELINRMLHSFGLLVRENGYAVHGRIFESGSGIGKKGIVVRAFDRDLRKLQELGETVTNDQGEYTIHFSKEKFAAGEPAPEGSPDLFVRALSNDGTILIESETRFHAATDEVIDLPLPVTDLSEWEKINAAVLPLLEQQGENNETLPPWELKEEDLDFLVAETLLERESLRHWMLAYHNGHAQPEWQVFFQNRTFSARSMVPDSSISVALYVMFYGWYRSGLPENTASLMALPADTLVSALDQSIEKHYIPSTQIAWSELIPSLLQQHTVQESFQSAEKGMPAGIGDALRIIPDADILSLDRADALGGQVAGILMNRNLNGELWKEVKKVVNEDKALWSIQRSVGLRNITGGHLPLMRQLMTGDPGSNWGNLEDLAANRMEDWKRMAEETGVPGHITGASEEEKISKYARELGLNVQKMHPSAFLRHRIQSGELPVDQAIQTNMVSLLAANPSMRLSDGSVLNTLASGDLQTGGLSQEEIKKMVPELMKVERMARITDNLEDVGPLISQGFASARHITEQHSLESFQEIMRPVFQDDVQAKKIYEKANDIVQATEGLIFSYSPIFGGLNLPVMPLKMKNKSNGSGVLGQSASLQQLFGSTDYCECGHGASLYSPAAYFTDLLHMLSKSPKFNNKSALDVLFARRSDLAEIDLTGQNALTELPYIDIVMEILEGPQWDAGLGYRVIRGNSQQTDFDPSLDAGTIPSALLADIASWGLPLSENTIVEKGSNVTNPGGANFKSWLIRDLQTGLKLRLIGVVPAAYRLRGGYQSLDGVQPGYRPWPALLSSVTQQISIARFPWMLPFNPARQESNAWLNSFGITRSDVINTFLAQNNWTDADAAFEFLDISRQERDILTQPPTTNAPDYKDWGFETAANVEIYDPVAGTNRGPGDWHALLKNVSLLKSKCRVSHRELRNILETGFIRAGAPKIEITGNECNAAAMRIEVMDAAMARRVHLFIRLWRKLGWSPRELDQAIATHNSSMTGTGVNTVYTTSFLIFVANISRLRKMTMQPVVHLLDLYGNTLHTQGYWDHSGSQPQKTLSRYQTWFYNPAGGKSLRAEFKINTSGTALETTARPVTGFSQPRITDHATFLSSASGIPEGEITSLLPVGQVTIAPEQITIQSKTGAAIAVENYTVKEFEILSGTQSPGSAYSLFFEESNDGQNFTVIAPASLQGNQNPVNLTSTTPQLQRIAYSGNQKFLRARVETTVPTNTLFLSVRVLLSTGIIADELSLSNLTVIARYAILRRITEMSVPELRRMILITGQDPFSTSAGPDAVLAVLENKKLLKALDLSIIEADTILRGPEENELTVASARVAKLLAQIRDAAHTIRDDSTVSADQRSVLLTRILTDRGWNAELITSMLGSFALGVQFEDYTVPLNVDPTGTNLPAYLVYDAQTKKLSAARSVRPNTITTDLTPLAQQATGDVKASLNLLLQISADRELILEKIYEGMRAKTLPVHKVSLAIAPVLIPESADPWRERFFYEPTTQELIFKGWMQETEKALLKALERTTTTAFGNAVDALFQASKNLIVTADNKLVERENGTTQLTAEQLLLDTPDFEDRCGLLLASLLPEWREQQLFDTVITGFSTELGTDRDISVSLLNLPCTVKSSKSFRRLIMDPGLLSSSPANQINRTVFPDAFDAALRILLLGNLVNKWKLEPVQTGWLSNQWTGIDLTGIPVVRFTDAPLPFSVLKSFEALFTLADKPVPGIKGLQVIWKNISSATPDFKQLQTVFDASEDDLRMLAGPAGLNITTSAAWKDPLVLMRLFRLLEWKKRFALPVALLLQMRNVQQPGRPMEESEQEVQSLRSIGTRTPVKNGSAVENKVLDEIRKRRRNSVTEYLVHRLKMRDVNDLFGHYLIDPMMEPVVHTSRIRQAISSVQLFIQRALMNLEPDVPPTSINKDHWSWMKNYRVWEANRKILLYPENWIEPELRDDKTPFFDDVVSALQQGDATSDKARDAVETFLEKLTDLSRAEIVATCSSYDEADRLTITHVFGRTTAEPHTYWYRQFRNQDPANPKNALGIWTSWVPLAADIEGDHLFPFVWQGRLFLFWAIFEEVAKEPSDAELQTGGKKNEKFWNIKIAWSEFKSGTWSARRLFRHPTLFIRLSPEIALKDSFFFSFTTGEAGVTIRIYWGKDPLMINTAPAPLDKFKNLETPVTILFFDGDNLRYGAGFIIYKSGLLQTPYLYFSKNPQNEVPSDLNSPTIAYHRNMGIDWNNYTSLSLPVRGLNGSITVFNPPTPRKLRLMKECSEGQPVFSAPSSTGGSVMNRKAVPFFVSDWKHQFFVYPTSKLTQFLNGDGTPSPYWGDLPLLNFYALDWPHANRFRKTLSVQGIDKLLSFDVQDKVKNPPLPYFNDYNPEADYIASYPNSDLDYSVNSATAQFNYELFFHVPFSIACALSKNQRFEEARRWFHFLFDPTDSSNGSSPERYWRFRPFREAGQGLPVEELVRRLADENDNTPEKQEFRTLISMWKDNPFKPHLVARMRIRSYMYSVVMKYLDNLLAWGDQLFRRDTGEALNEAAQLYILAAQILGRRPEGIPRRTRPVVKSYAELATGYLDDLSNELVAAENLVSGTPTGTGNNAPSNLRSLYFCVPNNPKIIEYYNKVEDRLFKLRNSLNIDGVFRKLALFEPAIDPSMLVRAAAAGLNVGAALSDAQAPLPFYRFQVMAQKATEICNEVKSLGSGLLSALEKNDGESLARLRSGQEMHMAQQVRKIKELQIKEAKTNMDSLGISLESAQKKLSHYVGLVTQMESMNIPVGQAGPKIQELAALALETIANTTSFAQSVGLVVDPFAAAGLELTKQVLSRAAQALSDSVPAENAESHMVPMNGAEKRQLEELKKGHDLQQKAMNQRMVAQLLALIPDITIGASGIASPVATFQLGGTLLSAFANFEASITDSKSSEHSYRASLHSILAGYQRRAQDWVLQAELASKEIEQITLQLKANTLRIAITSQELQNHDLQMQQLQDTDAFLRQKFTNQELYSWMSSQLAGMYFQTYQLAYDSAKRAERCFRHELGVDTTYIQFGYWDNLRKGLLSGEQLLIDIKRMEMAYLNQNGRGIELTRHVSLRQFDPVALIQLRTTGKCEFEIPEVLFDMDFPGHYFRRIKNVSVTVPCITGPYTGISGTLTLLSSKVREKATGNYTDDSNYTVSYLPTQSIATSNAQNDTGMFELNFRDDRYLPFEGAGVISRWRFQLPEDSRPFDYKTISDVVMHLRYTARDGGETLKSEARNAKNTLIADAAKNGLSRFISTRHEYPDAWFPFATPVGQSAAHKLEVPINPEQFPYLFRGSKITVHAIQLFLQWKNVKDSTLFTVNNPPLGDGFANTPLGDYSNGTALEIELTPTGTAAVKTSFISSAGYLNGIPHLEVNNLSIPVTNTSSLKAEIKSAAVQAITASLRKKTGNDYQLKESLLDDLYVVLHYKVEI